MQIRFICRRAASAMGRTGTIVAVTIAVLFMADTARAMTFDITGQNIFGSTVTGTINGDPTLSSVTAANLSVSRQSGAFDFIDNYSGMVLAVHNNAENFFPNITLFFSSIDAEDFLAASSGELATLIATNFFGQNTPEINALEAADTFSFAATVEAETPLPPTFPLLVAGIGVLCLLDWRRKKKPRSFVAQQENA
jgi:hypothetical protein